MPYSDPEKTREYQREYKRIQRAGGCQTPCQTRLPAEFRLKTARDILDLLDEQVNAVRNAQDASTLEKARCVGYLSGIALRAIEAGDVAARMDAIEAVLKQRKAARNGGR